MIGWLSGEGVCDLGSGPTACLYASLLWCWRCGGLACSPLTVMLCHGREAAELGDIHTVNSLGH